MSEESFGEFRLKAKIGAGGMANVYLAERTWSHDVRKQLCVKRILPKLASSPFARRLFMQEGELAALLTHANIVPAYEFGEVGQELYLAMEYVQGVALRDILKQSAISKRWLLEPTILAIGVKVLNALDYIHCSLDRRGELLNIVHRDVTPGNVLISVSGEVKLCDFGIAFSSSHPEAAGVRIGEKVRGKPGYVAPEQLLGESIDGRSDLFSFGVVLLEMLIHKRIFPYRALGERLVRLDDDSIRIRNLCDDSDLDPSLVSILRKVTDPDLAKRQMNAKALRRDLLSYAARYAPESLSDDAIRKDISTVFDGRIPVGQAAFVEGQSSVPSVSDRSSAIEDSISDSVVHEWTDSESLSFESGENDSANKDRPSISTDRNISDRVVDGMESSRSTARHTRSNDLRADDLEVIPTGRSIGVVGVAVLITALVLMGLSAALLIQLS